MSERPLGKFTLHYAAFMMVVFFLIPFTIMLVVSFYHRTPSFYEPGFEFTSYIRVDSPAYVDAFIRSMAYAAISATAAVVLGFPFTYLICRLRTSHQVVILVFILCVLSLSEVIVAFSWSVLLSQSAGISNVLVFLGFMDAPQSWARGTMAVLIGLTYYNLPFTVLLFYPSSSRLDPELPEAAATMGASPLRAFTTVVIPILRMPIMVGWIVMFVFTMGALVTPDWLGRPSNWMIANHISAEIMDRGNIPFGSALAIVYLIITAILLLTMRAIANRKAIAS